MAAAQQALLLDIQTRLDQTHKHNESLKRLLKRQGDLLTRLQRHQARTSELPFGQITFRNGEPLDYKGNTVPLPLAAFSETFSLDATFHFDKLSFDGLKTSTTRPTHCISGFSQVCACERSALSHGRACMSVSSSNPPTSFSCAAYVTSAHFC